MLTQKDYNELVKIINNSIIDVAMRMSPSPAKAPERDVYEIKRVLWPKKLVDELCSWLRRDNPLFDEAKFRAALEIGERHSEKTQMTKRR